jgi:aspartate racemase
MKELIGILAGMGPRSTAPFVDLVIDECQRQYGARNDDEFPPMMIYALPAPFYLDRPLDHDALRAAIQAGLRKLASTGVAFVAMPCNTAHIHYDALAAAIDVPLLNIVDEALGAMPASAARVALLATRPTVAAGIYQAAAARMGLELVALDRWQAQVDRVLGAIKSSTDRRDAQAIWRDLLDDLAAEEVDTALLACTDLNAVSTAHAGLAMLDATQCLAAATVREWLARQNSTAKATTPAPPRSPGRADPSCCIA